MVPPALDASRQLRRRLTPLIRRAGTVPDADRYRKHFPATAHLWLLVLYGLSGLTSVRQLHAVLVADRALQRRLGLTQGLSLSQLARSSTSRPAACIELLVADLVATARRELPPDPAWRLVHKVTAVDSTFLALSLKLSPWAQHGGHVPGVRLQTSLALARQIPEALRLHRANLNDHQALKTQELAALRGWTLLIDLGYYGHQQFARLLAAGVHVLSRLHPQAVSRVTATRQVPGKPTPDGDVILADETITLGSPNNRRGAVLPGLRLMTSRNRHGVEQRIVTDRFDLTAAELTRLDRRRWQIELFFRFVKRQLGMLTPLGHSRAAVWLTILVAILTVLLLRLSAAAQPTTVSQLSWLRALGHALVLTLRSG